MSPFLSASACLAGAVILLTACGGSGGASHSGRPVAGVRSAPATSSSSDAAGAVADPVQAAASGTPALTAQPAAPAPQPAAHESGPQAPGPRYSPAMAYDGARGEVVLFGGAAGFFRDVVFSDTWTLVGHRWTQRATVHSPSPRSDAEMAYDPAHHQVVLFGGRGPGLQLLTDTWLWDGADWTQAAPAVTPASTLDQGITFFAGTHTVLMLSEHFPGPSHLYSWDGTNWTDLTPGGGPPGIPGQGGLSVDPVRGVVVLLGDHEGGGTLLHWEFDGRTWTQRDIVTPPERSLIQTVTDERDHTIVMFGGTGHNDTWTWDGSRWTQQFPRHSPPVRTSTGPMPGMVYADEQHEVVVFGGFVDGVGALNDTWTWDGRDWRAA